MNDRNLNNLLVYPKGYHSLFTIHCVLFISVMQILFSVPVLAKENLDYSEVKSIVDTTHSIRDELLDRSTGKARIVFKAEMKGGKEAEDKLIKRFVEQFAIEQNTGNLSGQEEWVVEWYKKDSKNRYDISNLDIAETKIEIKQIPINKRIVVTPEKGIHYNPLSERAYVNTPPIKRRNPAYITNHFDIDFCYDIFGGGDLQAMLNYYEKLGIKPEIEKSFINEQECIKLEYYKEYKVKSGKTKIGKSCIWISPEMSYSVIKAELYSNMSTDYNELKLIESYEANYEEAKNYKGEWVLKSVRRYDGQGFRNESIAIEFEDVEIGVEVDDEIFTFEGLGVPPGTQVFDKTVKGQQPITYYYKSYPAGKVDDLMSIVNGTAVDDAKAIQLPMFIPCMNYALKEGKLYIYNLRERKFIEKVKRLEEACDQLVNEKIDFIAWNGAFLVSKEIKLSRIGDKELTQFRLNESKSIYAYYLPEEFELPMQIKWETEQGDGRKYLITVKKIDLNGLWISDITIIDK